MGKLLKPRGLKGALWLLVFNEISSSLKPGKQVWVELKEGKYSDFLIESLKITRGKSWVKFTEYNSCDAVSNLSGMCFSISRNDFTPLNDKQCYLVDLIGLKVLDENQNKIGSVKDTMILPAQNLIVVEANGTEFLIPFVDAHVTLFDKKNNIHILKNVEGLLN